MATDRVINVPKYIAWFSLLSVSFVMAVGCYDLLEFMYKIAARLIH